MKTKVISIEMKFISYKMNFCTFISDTGNFKEFPYSSCRTAVNMILVENQNTKQLYCEKAFAYIKAVECFGKNNLKTNFLFLQ